MRSILYSLIFLKTIITLSAQPANDDCINAISIPLGASEQQIILTNGTTTGATQSDTPESICAQTWFDDDVWFKFTTPDTILSNGFTVKAYFDYFMDTTDVNAIGMAIYSDCDSTASPLRCFSSNDPKDNALTLSEPCIAQNQTYYIRIWSTGNTSATEGNFRIGVFVNQHTQPLLWKETFANGIENSGWTTGGTCKEPDSNHNAGFKYHANGVFDDGHWIYEGFSINSPSLCDGAVGVDSDYNNTSGLGETWGPQPCSFPSMHYLTSPIIYTGDWSASGITLSWHQALRNFESQHFMAYRWRDEFSEWSEWQETEVNVEFPRFGELVTDNIQRYILPYAAHHDSLQFRFRYVDNYYFWIIDNVALLQTEANNIALDTGFFAIPPFAKIPADQVDEYFALAAVQNIGVEEQHNVQIHHTVKKEGSNEIVEDQTISVGNLPALFHDTTKWFFPDPVNIPAETENYIGTYNVTQDEIDSDTSDNHIEYHFTVGGSTFAHEDGPTRSFNFQQSSVFIKTEAWGYGNVFYPVKDVAVRGLTFGAVLDESLPGDSINLNLIEWHDQNNDQIAQTSERILVGTGRYYFDETTGWIVTTVPLENIAEPGSQIVMSGGKIYFAMMEYLSNDISNKGKVKMLASEERNFVPTVAAFDSAYVHGLTDRRRYMSVLQFSPDGVISNVDFFVRPLVPWPNLHPGDHIVPMLRIETEFINSAQNVFASDMISVFPNPTQDFIRISIDPDLNADIMDISIGDMMGRIIQHFPDAQLYDGKYQIDIRGLADGVYTIVIHTGNQVYNKPVIVF